MPDIPFAWRIAALGAVALIAVCLDRRKPPDARHRWREYTVLFISAGLGVTTGISVDAVTSTLSPDYFIHGKEIVAGPGFKRRVLELGAHAGASAGVIAGALLLVANREPHRAFRLLRVAWLPVAGAILSGTLFGLAQWLGTPVALDGLSEFLPPDRAARFTIVWITHIGLYTGGVLGLTWAIVQTRRTIATEAGDKHS